MTRLDISPFARVVARADRARDGEPDAGLVPSGFPSLDRLIGGGLRRGDLTVLGGDHGAGCSALALGMAMRRPAPALLLTGEMHADRVYERALASHAAVSLEAVRRGTIDEAARVRLAAASLTLREQSPLVDLLGSGGLATVSRALEAAPQVSLVIVDGLESLLDRDTDRDDALAFAVLALKRLALAHNVALLLLTHLPLLDRTRQDRRPTLSDFGVRGAVGSVADLVLGLFREELYESDLGLAGATELLLLKQREGTLGYADLYFQAQWLRFEDVLDPDR